MIIGLTGSIATGKSTVSTILKEMNIPVIDADYIAREVVAKDSIGLKKIVEAFGSDVLLENGELNRSVLGSIIFSSEEKRVILNQITHPLIRERMNELQEQYEKEGHKLIILDIPLLIESRANYKVDEVWVVYVNEEIQLERLQKRNNYTYEEAKKRISSQISIEEKAKKADRIINNEGSIENTRQQVEEIINKLRTF